MLIDFSVGQPTHKIFDTTMLQSMQLHRNKLTDFFYYADKRGSKKLRQDFIELYGSHQSSIEGIIITYGVLNSIDLIVKAYLSTIDKVYVLNPTYKEAISLFRTYGLPLHPIPFNKYGIDFNTLRANVEGYSSCFYVISNLNNPDGVILSLSDRHQLTKLCLETNSLLIDDDIYRDSFFESISYPTLFEIANSISSTHTVFHLVSLSKSLMPGLRIGFLEGAENTINHLLKYKFDFGTSPMLSFITNSLLKDRPRFENNKREYAYFLSRQKNKLLHAFRNDGNYITLNNPQGGYFLWGELPQNCNTDDMLPIARRNGVLYTPGSAFRIDGKTNFLRLSYGYVNHTLFAEGARRLIKTIQQATEITVEHQE